jgi:hypothetical protein
MSNAEPIEATAGSKTRNALAVWLTRLLMAALLIFGSEVLLWNNLQTKSAADWIILLLGNLILGTLVLDLLVRLRLRDLAGLMTLAGLYALLNSLIINPQSTLFELPRTLVTRVTGAHSLVALEMLVLFLATLSRSRGLFRRVIWPGLIAIGIAWGTWVRWSSTLDEGMITPVDRDAMLVVGVLSFVLIVLLYLALSRQSGNTSQLQAGHVLLTRIEWFAVIISLLILLMIRLAQGVLPSSALLIVGVIIALCYAMLWFRQSTKLPPFSEMLFPPQDLRLLWYMGIVALFLFSALVAYDAPEIRAGEFNQLSIIVYGFTLYGLAWLPTVSLWLGMRAYLRQISARSQ